MARKILLSTIVLLGLHSVAFGQSITLSLGSTTGTAGGTVVLPISLTSAGGAQTSALEWTFSYSSDITSVTVAAGTSTTAAGKSLSCSGNNCLIMGFNSAVIADGPVATATFQISGQPSSNPITIQLTGVVASTAGGISIPSSGSSGAITLPVSVSLRNLNCTSLTINTPGTGSCTVTLNGTAPAGGFPVSLSSNNTNLTVPASVTVASGQTSNNFTATGAQVSANQSGVIMASGGGVNLTNTISLVAPPQLSSLACAPSTLGSNASSTCTVTLSKAATSAATVTLASNNVLLTVPANVVVASGQGSATFTATSGTVSTSQGATVTATLNGLSQPATISLAAAAQMSSLSCTPATVNAPGSSTCTVTLTAAAVSTASVTLSSNNANMTVPASVNIGAGLTSATFSATVVQVGAAQAATITAGLGNSTQSVVLSLAQTKGAAAESSASASASPLDTSTQGTWKGVYGADGEIIANDSDNPPAYLSVPAAGLFTGASTYTWVASSAEPRALQKAASATDRIASTFYAGASYTIDLPFTDGLLHQVSLYLLDLDTYERAETIAILDRASNAVLSTQSFANFHTGTWATWNIQGPVRIQVTRTAGLNAVVSGLFFKTLFSGATPSAAPPTVSISAPFANQQISGTQVLSAIAAAANVPGASIVSVQFQLDGNNLGPAVTSGSPYTFSWASGTTGNGPHSLVAVATDNFSQSTTSAAVVITVNNQLTTSAVFVKNDATTEGTWKGVYGADGEIVAQDSFHLPAYAAASFPGAQLFQWAVTGDPRALQEANSATLRIASTYYGNPSFSMDLNLTDGNTHQVALYFMDWDGGGRAETVTILDASTQALLDTPRQVSNFIGGQYLVWNLKGHVTIHFNLNSGANTLLNGIFLAPSAP